MNCARAVIAVCCLWLVPLTGDAEPTGADAPPSVDAIWVEKKIEFTYMAFTTFYSCDGLRDKLRWVLKEIGARPGFKVTVTGCTYHGPEIMPRAKIRAALPRQATPELLEELARDAPKRELIARATGRSDELSEATAQFPARTRRIEIEDERHGRIEAGDCELVEHLRDFVFAPLGVTVVEDDVRCSPKQVTPGSVHVTLEVLEPVPTQ